MKTKRLKSDPKKNQSSVKYECVGVIRDVDFNFNSSRDGNARVGFISSVVGAGSFHGNSALPLPTDLLNWVEARAFVSPGVNLKITVEMFVPEK